MAAGASLALCLGAVTFGSSVVVAGAATKTPGVTAKQVTIGATVPLTGIASNGYSDTGKAANAVFKYINSKGGVNGRKIRYIMKDDCYGTPGFGCTGTPSTVTQTHALLSVPVFATVGSLGTPTQDSVRALLKANKVPQLFVNSGSRDWNNPAQYPSLFGWQPSYNAEAKIFAKYILATYGPNENVCFLGQGDDIGADGLAGLVAGGVPPSDTQLYSVNSLVLSSGASIAPYIARFQSDKCGVVVMYTIPGATQAAIGAALKLSYSPHWVISSIGSDPVTIDQAFSALPIPDPEIGAVSFAYIPASTDTTAWNAWMTKVLLKDKADFPNFTATSPITGNMANGIGWGVAFVEALKAAGKNFTRASFLKVLTKTTFSQTPALLPLRYSASNHQGLTGGYLDTIKSATQTQPLDGKVYSTDSGSGPVTTVKKVSKGIPSWLK